MNELLEISWGTGLRDGLNPCIFMTCAFFIVQGSWFSKGPWSLIWLRIIFVVVYAASFINFNFGLGQYFIFNKEFILGAKILYLVLSVCTFILGLLFLKDWYLLHRSQSEDVSQERPRAQGEQQTIISRLSVLLTTILLAVSLSAMATLWPINKYIFLLSNEAFLKGQWQSVMPLLIGYVLTGMWPLLFVWAFLSIRQVRISLLKIISASIFFTASSCMVFIFK